MFVDREQQRYRMDKMRSDVLQDRSFPAGLADEAKRALFKIPETAVDQFGRGAGSAAGKIAFVDERDAQSAQSGIAGDAGAEDATANDERVELFGSKGSQVAVHGLGGRILTSAGVGVLRKTCFHSVKR